MEGFPIPPLSRGRSALHHAVYHVGCTICPEPNVVQDRVQDKALNLTWFRGGGWGIYVAVVLRVSQLSRYAPVISPFPLPQK